MDLIELNTLDGPVYSFLSVTWGMIADIDIESERFRHLGGARFLVEALYRIVSKWSCSSNLFTFILFHTLLVHGPK